MDIAKILSEERLAFAQERAPQNPKEQAGALKLAVLAEALWPLQRELSFRAELRQAPELAVHLLRQDHAGNEYCEGVWSQEGRELLFNRGSHTQQIAETIEEAVRGTARHLIRTPPRRGTVTSIRAA